MKQKIVLIIAGGMGLLAFILTRVYIQAERAEIYRNAARTRVVVARQNMAAGTEISADSITTEEVFETGVNRQDFRADNRDLLLGRTLRYPVAAGDTLSWIHVGMNIDGVDSLAPTVRTGMRAISIPVSAETSVSGLVRPNDRVDIIGTFSFVDERNPAEMETVTFTVLQDVTILATGQETARMEMEIVGGGRRRSSYNTVTIAVFPQEAELIEFAKNVRGSLALSLRNPNDIQVMSDAPPINFQELQEQLPRLNESRQRILRGQSSELLRR